MAHGAILGSSKLEALGRWNGTYRLLSVNCCRGSLDRKLLTCDEFERLGDALLVIRHVVYRMSIDAEGNTESLRGQSGSWS